MTGAGTAMLVADSLLEFGEVDGVQPVLPPAPAMPALPSPKQIRARIGEWEVKFAKAKSAATVRAVRSDWQQFVTWCQYADTWPLPVASDHLIAFLGDMVQSGRRRATINRYLYTVRLIHQAAGLPDPAAAPMWKLEWEAIVRQLAARRANGSRQAEPLQSHGVEAILSKMATTPKGLRDAALISLASDTLCRESELVVVRLENLSPPAAGSQNWTLTIENSKTDQEGIGMERFVSAATKARIDAWCEVAGIKSGFIFLPLGGRPKQVIDGEPPPPEHLNPREVARILRQHAKAAAVPNGHRMSGHSARVGSAIDLADSDASIKEIQYAGGWAGDRMVLRYARKSMAGSNAMARLRRQQGQLLDNAGRAPELTPALDDSAPNGERDG